MVPRDISSDDLIGFWIVDDDDENTEIIVLSKQAAGVVLSRRPDSKSGHRTVADLTSDDNPKVVSQVVAKALGLNEAQLPKDVLVAARKAMPSLMPPARTIGPP